MMYLSFILQQEVLSWQSSQGGSIEIPLQIYVQE